MGDQRLDEPDLFVSPDGRCARSVRGATEDDKYLYRLKGWKQVSFAQHVDDIAPLVLKEALSALAKEIGGRQ